MLRDTAISWARLVPQDLRLVDVEPIRAPVAMYAASFGENGAKR